MSDYAYDYDADQPYPVCDRCGMQDDTVRVYLAPYEADPAYCPDCAADINAELDARDPTVRGTCPSYAPIALTERYG